MENEEYPYQKAWEQYRLFIRLLVILIPTFIVSFVLLSGFRSSIVVNLLAAAAVLSVFIVVGINFAVAFWKCPRCRRLFFRWWQHTNMLFATECKNCGLKKYEGSNIKGIFAK